jgi:hypothetical protein
MYGSEQDSRNRDGDKPRIPCADQGSGDDPLKEKVFSQSYAPENAKKCPNRGQDQKRWIPLKRGKMNGVDCERQGGKRSDSEQIADRPDSPFAQTWP